MAKATELAEALSQFQSNEQKRRDTFKSDVVGYLPFAIRGIEDAIPYCEVTARSNIDNLPDITRQDVFGKWILRIEIIMEQ